MYEDNKEYLLHETIHAINNNYYFANEWVKKISKLIVENCFWDIKKIVNFVITDKIYKKECWMDNACYTDEILAYYFMKDNELETYNCDEFNWWKRKLCYLMKQQNNYYKNFYSLIK